jgi:hypothetical protein
MGPLWSLPYIATFKHSNALTAQVELRNSHFFVKATPGAPTVAGGRDISGVNVTVRVENNDFIVVGGVRLVLRAEERAAERPARRVRGAERGFKSGL